jgi:hypothetical protein
LRCSQKGLAGTRLRRHEVSIPKLALSERIVGKQPKCQSFTFLAVPVSNRAHHRRTARREAVSLDSEADCV